MTENQEVHFQDYAFDPKLRKGRAKNELLKLFPEEDLEDILFFEWFPDQKYSYRL